MKTKTERADHDHFYLGLLGAVCFTVAATLVLTLAFVRIACALSRWWN